MGAMRNVCNIATGKPGETRPFGRFRHTWWDNIKMNIKEILYGNVNYINLVQD
jgi:hypothetical protein